GDAAGMGEAHVDSAVYDADVERQGKHAIDAERLEQRRAISGSADAAVDATGYKDPAGEVARARQMERIERDEAMGRVDHATSVSGEAQATVADPSGAAKTAATDAGLREASERAP